MILLHCRICMAFVIHMYMHWLFRNFHILKMWHTPLVETVVTSIY